MFLYISNKIFRLGTWICYLFDCALGLYGMILKLFHIALFVYRRKLYECRRKSYEMNVEGC